MADNGRPTGAETPALAAAADLAGLWAERLARAFWPLWTIADRRAGRAGLRAAGSPAAGGGMVRPGWRGCCRRGFGRWWRACAAFARPTRAEALARLDARLPGQPIAALPDTSGHRRRRSGLARGLAGASRAHGRARGAGAGRWRPICVWRRAILSRCAMWR